MSAKLLMPIIKKMSTGNTADRNSSSPKLIDDSSSSSPSSLSSSPSNSSATSLSPPSTSPFFHNNKRRYHLVVMGAGGVGKTSLIKHFLYGKVPSEYHPTVEDMYATEFSVGENEDESFMLEVLDTSGTMKFPAMQALNMARGDGFILVYSVTDAESFEEVRQLREEIIAAKEEAESWSANDSSDDGFSNCPSESRPQVPIVIVGNKADCSPAERQVSTIEAETLVAIDWENAFVETSALTGRNVVKIFRELIKQSGLDLDLDAALAKRSRVYPASPDICSSKHKRSQQDKQAVPCIVS